MGRLIDAHIHFWDPGARHHQWLGEVPDLASARSCRHRFGMRVPDGLVFVEADCAQDEAFERG